MNVTNDILSILSIGTAAAPQKPASQGLVGFLNTLIQQLQPAGESAGTLDVQALTEKLAALLKTDGALPPEWQNLSSEELSAKLAALIQQNSDGAIKPALTQDLAAALAPKIQEALENAETPATPKKLTRLQDILSALENKKELPAEDLAALLNEIEPAAAGEIKPELIQVLKDKVAALLESEEKPSPKALAQLRDDMIRILKDEGLEKAEAERHIEALITHLKKEVSTTAEKIVADTHTDAPAEKLEKEITLAKDIQKNVAERMAQAGRSQQLPSPEKTAADAPRPDTPPPAPTPQPQQNNNVSAKVNGFGLSPETINALAAGNDGLSQDGSDFNGNTPRDQLLNGDLASMKALSADAALQNQSFANYMTQARGAAAAPATQMVNVQLLRNINAKVDMMTLQLHPADLGRVDIRLKFEKDGSVHARLSVDTPETLALLQKDAHHLERTLQQNGLKVDENTISFDLRQQGQQQQNLQGYDNGNRPAGNNTRAPDGDLASNAALQAQIAVESHGYVTQSGVNIMV